MGFPHRRMNEDTKIFRDWGVIYAPSYQGIFAAAESHINSHEGDVIKAWLENFDHSVTCAVVSWDAYHIATASTIKKARAQWRDTMNRQHYSQRNYAWDVLKDLLQTRIEYLARHPQDEKSPEHYYRYSTGFPLLNLPLELREKVYTHLVLHESTAEDETLYREFRNISLVNRLVHEEFAATLYRQSTFRIVCWPTTFELFSVFGPSYPLKAGLSDTPFDPMLQRIQHWNISFFRWFDNTVHDLENLRMRVEEFCSLVQHAGCVKTLTIDVSNRQWFDTGLTYDLEDDGCAMTKYILKASMSKPRKRVRGVTDLEYVIQPLFKLRNLQRVEIKLCDQYFKPDLKLKGWKEMLETLMMSDFEEDFHYTSQWSNLREAARKSLYLPGK